MAKMMGQEGDKDTPGERRIYRLLKNELPDSYLVWNNKKVYGCKEIDFIVFEPSLGVWLIEVKDWVIDQIVHPTDADIKMADHSLPLNPHKQVENCWKDYMRELGKIPSLLDSNKKLKFPLSRFVVFTNITASEIKVKGYERVLVLDNSWTSDFIAEDYLSPGDVEEALLNRRDPKFKPKLGDVEVNDIKKYFGYIPVVNPATKQEVGELDKYQTGLIDLPIDKQYVIEGPAGSGKSLVLIGRAIRIAKEKPDWQIGIFCFNAFMSNYLRIIISLDESYADIKEKIQVLDFSAAKYTESLGKFDAILVDEGQDATDENLKFCRDLLVSETAAFTIFFDRRQNIYVDQAISISDRLNDLGFNIDGEKRLVKQQRSALVILALSIFEKINNPDKTEKQILDKVVNDIAPKIFDSGILARFESGAKSIWKAFSGLVGIGLLRGNSEEHLGKLLLNSFTMQKVSNDYIAVADLISNWIKGNSENTYSEFVILVPFEKMVAQLSVVLASKKIPHAFIHKNGFMFDGEASQNQDNRRSFDVSNNCVKIMTIHQAKGFDCRHVIILNIEYLDSEHASKSELGKRKAELTYAALTRAKSECLVIYKEETRIIKSLLSFKNLIAKSATEI